MEDTYAFIAFFAFIAFGAAFAAFIALAIAMRVVGGGRALGEGTLKPELPTHRVGAKRKQPTPHSGLTTHSPIP